MKKICNYKTDQHYMRRCIALAVRYYGQTEPNPVVGALVVKDGKIIGKGAHVRAGFDHAEVVALKQAGEQARGATLYVTLEPCNHHGKTGPCSEAIINAGISKVVYGLADPNPKACGGEQSLRQNGIIVFGGMLSEQIGSLLEPWLFSLKHSRQLIQLLAVTALDGSLINKVPRLAQKYFKNAVNLHSELGKDIFEKGEFDQIILVRTMHNSGSSWPLGVANLTMLRTWSVGDIIFSIYKKNNV